MKKRGITDMEKVQIDPGQLEVLFMKKSNKGIELLKAYPFLRKKLEIIHMQNPLTA